jgi:16S rRNA (adenine1518-N6/adenine1519-N6)-dimethyltransferase
MKKKFKEKSFAKKSLGQNFLIDENYIGKIVDSLDLQKDETVIEIGPGRGALTEKLIEKGGNVIAIELDSDLIPVLHEAFGKNEKFRLVESDALKIDFSKFKIQDSKSKNKLVANLPYYISTAILQHLAIYRENFSELVLMLQKEVVERITAEAGNSDRGFLTVLIEAFFQSEKLFDVPPNAFFPAPKVWSAIVRLTPKENSFADLETEKLFREIISAGFAQKRKTISNNLKNYLDDKNEAEKVLTVCEIEPNRRAETLSIEEWKRIVNILNHIET